MSRNMQMRVHIVPYYKQGFEKVYPNIFHGLRHVEGLFEKDELSLFALVGKYGKILHTVEGDESVRSIFAANQKGLAELYEKVEEHIADWQLAKADQALYKMEDLFDDMEKELGKI